MPGSPNYVANAQPASGVVANPSTEQNNDTQSQVLRMGRQGDLLVSEIHGRMYTAAARGNLFIASAAGFTGVAPLAPGGTTAGFMFYNPAGSGVNMEIHRVRAIPLTATDVVGGIGLEYGAPPSAVGTAATIVAMPLAGGKTPLCKAAYGSTIVAMAYLASLFFVQSTGGLIEPTDNAVNMDGLLVLAPNTAVNIVSTTTQSTNKWLQDVIWSEWPV